MVYKEGLVQEGGITAQVFKGMGCELEPVQQYFWHFCILKILPDLDNKTFLQT